MSGVNIYTLSMATGVHAIPRSVLIDRELSCQTGRSLREWAMDHGVSFENLRRILDGIEPENESLLVELAETLGVSVRSLRATA